MFFPPSPRHLSRERAAQLAELNRQVRALLATDPQARIVVLGAGGLSGLRDLTARSLPVGGKAFERVWVSAGLEAGADSLRLDVPADPTRQVLHLQP